MTLPLMNKNKLQTKTNIYSQQQKTIKNKPSLQNVRQDKRRFSSAAPEPVQPAAGTKITRGAYPHKATMVCSQNESVQQSRTAKTTLWLEPIVRAALEKEARAEGITVSAAGNASIKRDLQRNADLRYNFLLEPIIKNNIDRNMRQISRRLSWLLVRVAFDAGQTRGIVTNILGTQLGAKQELLQTILAESAKAAKSNITRRTPQMTELMDTLEKWLMGEEEQTAGR